MYSIMNTPIKMSPSVVFVSLKQPDLCVMVAVMAQKWPFS